MKEWSDTAVSSLQLVRSLHDLVQEQVERSQDRVALVFEQEQLTYRQLNERANQLAHYLRRLRVGRDVLVGVYMERSIEMVVGLLGILKAGGAYVPLDPTHPPERISFVLADASVPVLLTQQRLARNLPKTGVTLVYLDTDWDDINLEKTDAPDVTVTHDDLAYLIYTSGSTGNPKGVEIPHRAVVNLLSSMRRKPGLEARDTLLAVTTLTFDIAALELFLPLCVGAKLVIASRESAADGNQLLALLRMSCATVMQATPVTWKLLLEAGWDGNPKLKVLCGGEALPRELANELVKRASSVWNMYGPTETTIWSAVGEVKAGTEPVPIGQPIDNTQFYVLDGNGKVAPVGMPGELHIGGEGLARGYFRSPELTAEKFILHSFTGANGRLFKTGDSVRRLSDGTLDFLGRLDHQVKLRGFRVGLEEIEALLGAHPGVSQAVVVLREDVPGEKQLVAYVVATDAHKGQATELRDSLRKDLPEYMVPATFVFIRDLPRLPNGKINRKALPVPDIQECHTFVAPRNSVERSLVEIWEELLGRKNIGIQNNFFDLGGHSLLATRLFIQIERIFGVRLPISTLFKAPTIEQLSGLLQSVDNAASSCPLVEIQPNGSRPPFFCVHGASGNVVIYRALSRHLGPNQPFYGLQSQGLDGQRPPLRRIEDMASLYIEAIRKVQPHGPYHLGGYCMGGTVALEMAQQFQAQGEKVALLALFDTVNTSNLSPVTTLGRVCYEAQRLLFHAGNLLFLNSRDQVKFFRAKLDVLRSRSNVWRGLLLRRFTNWPESKSESLLLAQIWQINDRAARNYVPRSYCGVITDFRPRRQYTKFNEPGLKWSELALEGQDVVVLPLYPAGMLLEPFVEHLAAALTASIDRAIRATHAMPAGRP